jgi:hypothetical protein
MAANEDRPLTQWEIEEIKRCEAIVKFSEDVLAGRHPRIKIQPHLVNIQVIPELPRYWILILTSA